MSAICPKCSSPLDRQRRSSVERVLYRKLWVCRSCGTRVHAWRIPLEATWLFLSTRYTSCIMCGNTRVRRIPARDRIDAMSAHPVSMLFGLAGAPIYHCNACRHQYHDWRPLRAVASQASAAASGAADGLAFGSAADSDRSQNDRPEDALVADAPVLRQRSEP